MFPIERKTWSVLKAQGTRRREAWILGHLCLSIGIISAFATQWHCKVKKKKKKKLISNQLKWKEWCSILSWLSNARLYNGDHWAGPHRHRTKQYPALQLDTKHHHISSTSLNNSLFNPQGYGNNVPLFCFNLVWLFWYLFYFFFKWTKWIMFSFILYLLFIYLMCYEWISIFS